MAVAKPNPIQTQINEIVKRIPRGRSFDSHFVIETLVRQYTLEYAAFLHGKKDLAWAHADLSAMIPLSALAVRLTRTVAGRTKEVSFQSPNLRGKLSTNAAWTRI